MALAKSPTVIMIALMIAIEPFHGNKLKASGSNTNAPKKSSMAHRTNVIQDCCLSFTRLIVSSAQRPACWAGRYHLPICVANQWTDDILLEHQALGIERRSS